MVVLAGVLGVVGVAIGAHAAHGLEAMLAKQSLAPEAIAKRLDQCEVAVRYHMMHTITLLAIGLSGRLMGRLRNAAAIFLLLGIALFSGGLYSMVYLGVMGHWAIVPSGGLCFILGWGAIVLSGLLSKSVEPA